MAEGGRDPTDDSGDSDDWIDPRKSPPDKAREEVWNTRPCLRKRRRRRLRKIRYELEKAGDRKRMKPKEQRHRNVCGCAENEANVASRRARYEKEQKTRRRVARSTKGLQSRKEICCGERWITKWGPKCPTIDEEADKPQPREPSPRKISRRERYLDVMAELVEPHGRKVKKAALRFFRRLSIKLLRDLLEVVQRQGCLLPEQAEHLMRVDKRRRMMAQRARKEREEKEQEEERRLLERRKLRLKKYPGREKVAKRKNRCGKLQRLLNDAFIENLEGEDKLATVAGTSRANDDTLSDTSSGDDAPTEENAYDDTFFNVPMIVYDDDDDEEAEKKKEEEAERQKRYQEQGAIPKNSRGRGPCPDKPQSPPR